MKKLDSNLPNMVIVLTLITLLASFLLASVYGFTKEPIAVAKERKKEIAIKTVLPEFDTIENDTIDDIFIYKAYKNNEWVGSAIESSSKNGFSGDIKIMVGFDKQGSVYNYSVLEQKETPGLGTKMVDWFKTDKNNQSIIGKKIENKPLQLTKDGGEIDAITASTITSRAFLEAVNDAYKTFSKTDAYTGATNINTSNETDSTTAATPWVEEN